MKWPVCLDKIHILFVRLRNITVLKLVLIVGCLHLPLLLIILGQNPCQDLAQSRHTARVSPCLLYTKYTADNTHSEEATKLHITLFPGNEKQFVLHFPLHPPMTAFKRPSWKRSAHLTVGDARQTIQAWAVLLLLRGHRGYRELTNVLQADVKISRCMQQEGTNHNCDESAELCCNLPVCLRLLHAVETMENGWYNCSTWKIVRWSYFILRSLLLRASKAFCFATQLHVWQDFTERLTGLRNQGMGNMLGVDFSQVSSWNGWGLYQQQSMRQQDAADLEKDCCSQDCESGEHHIVDRRDNSCIEQIQSFVQIVHLSHHADSHHLHNAATLFGELWLMMYFVFLLILPCKDILWQCLNFTSLEARALFLIILAISSRCKCMSSSPWYSNMSQQIWTGFAPEVWASKLYPKPATAERIIFAVP